MKYNVKFLNEYMSIGHGSQIMLKLIKVEILILSSTKTKKFMPYSTVHTPSLTEKKT